MTFTFVNANSISAAQADPMEYKITINYGKYSTMSGDKGVSYKYYKGTNKIDKSAYVINSNSSINFSHYISDKAGNRKSNFGTHIKTHRTSYKNYALRDVSYGCRLWASREHLIDRSYTISGSWSSDDKLK
jgi:hypothetical protein